MKASKTALIVAGGTGGHIFPGLAVAQELRAQGWQVHWVGAPDGMEARIAQEQGLPFEAVHFAGVRGKGWLRWLSFPLQLLGAVRQSWRIARRLRPAVVVGMGGYITVPMGLAARMAAIPVFLHEQNAIAGLSNRLLSRMASRVFTAFPNVLAKGQWVGNPLRSVFTEQGAPRERYAQRTGPLRVLVMGGSLGAKALNEVVPKALSTLMDNAGPSVIHQGGAKQLDALQAQYAAAGVQAQLLPFIDDVAGEMAQADLLICRAGASTVCEISAVGVAALLVPFPFAVDDHQTKNAEYLAGAQAALLYQQHQLTPEILAGQLRGLSRDSLSELAQAVKRLEKIGAAQAIAAECEAWVK